MIYGWLGTTFASKQKSFFQKRWLQNLHKNTGSTNRINVRTEAKFHFWCKNGNAYFLCQVFVCGACQQHAVYWSTSRWMKPNDGDSSIFPCYSYCETRVLWLCNATGSCIEWACVLLRLCLSFAPWSIFQRVELIFGQKPLENHMTPREFHFWTHISCSFFHWIEKSTTNFNE